jgi:quercetin dioxygenase-like cupin family protein
MKKFDVVGMEANAYDQREKNVFYEKPEFKLRIIDLASGQSMPRCDMMSHVVFVCVEGEVEVSVGVDKTTISRGQCLVTMPATISMQTKPGARLLGIQITSTSTNMNGETADE